jgi:hypothetical protein
MNPFVDPKKRSVSLPRGCKDLADVLERPKHNKFNPVRQFLTLLLMEARQASQLVIGPEPEIGALPTIKYKVGDTWHEFPYASEARPSLIAELQHMAGLPTSQFPSEGALSLRLETIQLKWKVQIVSPDSECLLTPIVG